jgi:peptidoglycan/xylan/chitin deacetylase (PgdA/CDA1 family)
MTSPIVITLMFHRINDVNQQFNPLQFSHYLDYLVHHFPIVVPGESLPDTPVAVCLTFDDAYYDFYHNVYPLLQKHKVKGILAVPTKYILDETTQSPETRLNVPYPYEMENPYFAEKSPLCTWQELREMAQSDQIILASHGHSHANLIDKKTNLQQELSLSKQILEAQLGKAIHYFVYPFGRMTQSIHREVCKIYDYGIRIGNALNLGWDQTNRYVYRINADPLWVNSRSIDQKLIRKLTVKYWINRIRNK